MCRSPPSGPPSSKCTSCLLLLSFPHFSAGCLRFHRVVGAGDVFSTSRTINFQKKWPPTVVSISRVENRRRGGGSKMTSDALVVHVSRDWAIACDVQQRFMQSLDPSI